MGDSTNIKLLVEVWIMSGFQNVHRNPPDPVPIGYLKNEYDVERSCVLPSVMD